MPCFFRHVPLRPGKPAFSTTAQYSTQHVSLPSMLYQLRSTPLQQCFRYENQARPCSLLPPCCFLPGPKHFHFCHQRGKFFFLAWPYCRLNIQAPTQEPCYSERPRQTGTKERPIHPRSCHTSCSVPRTPSSSCSNPNTSS